MNTNNLHKYYEMEGILKDLFKKSYISFDEWYKTLVELRKEYNLMFVEVTN